MFSLPLLTPRDSHDLWFGPRTPQPHLTEPSQSSNPTSAAHAQAQNRRHGTSQYRAGSTATHGGGGGGIPSALNPSDTLASLILEERALRARKNNIASFGCSWIKPAGCPKTMLGMKEEEAEREEAAAAADAEFAAAAAAAAAAGGEGMDEDGEEGETGMERDLDADIPDAEEEGEGEEEGLVEDGEEGLEEDEGVDEEEYMERDLDDDIPEEYPDYDDDDEEDFDNQPDLDDEIPSADEGVEYMSELEHEEEEGEEERDLDDDIPEAEGPGEEEEWQHTDTDAEFDDEEDEVSFAQHPFRTSTASSSARGLPPVRERVRETEAQRRFLQRWSGGGDAFDTSTMSMSMMVDEYDHDHHNDHGRDLRASLASQTSRRSSGGTSVFGRFPRRRGRMIPRDSLEY
ncbi:Apc15p protein-domain-containing protein [Aspergillus keveii]|uniref:Apc15p protein-domain-containing protein n=1 Tax=Aspergillus keveii TaxID=714993 RepID=A0ABR4FX55_9EURO